MGPDLVVRDEGRAVKITCRRRTKAQGRGPPGVGSLPITTLFFMVGPLRAEDPNLGTRKPAVIALAMLGGIKQKLASW